MSDYGKFYEDIFNGLVKSILNGIIIVSIFCTLIGIGIIKLIDSRDIVTNVPLKPVIKPYYNEDLKRLDTIYIYKKP